MILDTQNRFTGLTPQSIAAAAGDVVSTDIIDTAPTTNIFGNNHDQGIGEEMSIVVRTATAVTSGGAATVQFILQTDDNSGFSSAREFPLTGALALTALTANTVQYRGKLPAGLERYLRVVARIAAATTTAGTMEAFLVKDVQDQRQYASGFVVA